MPRKFHSKDTIRIFLRDCRVKLRVGIHAPEKKAPQLLIVTVEMEADLTHRYDDPGEHNLDRVIDYQPLYHFIRKKLPKLGHIPLLESVAEQIILFCWRDPRVQKVRVRLEKPDILPAASAGIDITRSRPKKRQK